MLGVPQPVTGAGGRVAGIAERPYQGEVLARKPSVAAVGGNGAFSTYPVVGAKLILCGGCTTGPWLLLGKMNLLGMGFLKGQAWIES